jgi:Zn-dependent peptidase ImmA (M78 family)
MFIMVNQNHSLEKQHFTIAIRTTTILFNQILLTKMYYRIDKQTDSRRGKADCFAANLLLPELGVYDHTRKREKKEE